MVLRALLALLVTLPSLAADDPTRLVLHMLDYVAVDYAGAVAEGRVIDDAEFQEMREFTTHAIAQIRALPASPARDALDAQAVALAQRVEERADPSTVAAAAHALTAAIIETYGVRTAPARRPDPALGARIYTANCAPCHGVTGAGDGRAAPGLDPAPSNFHDAERMMQHSLYGLYNTVTLGVDGTAMASFDLLSEHERWSVATYVARFTGDAPSSGLDRASRLLAQSVAACREGRRDEALQLAIQAYLDGFELVEPSLANLDRKLMRESEEGMLALRVAIRQEAPVEEIEQRVQAIEQQLARAREVLRAEGLSPVATFTSSFLILLREGLEAIIVLAAVVAAVRKAGRRDALPYVHAGWIAAIALGLLTWTAATYAIEISGANREITEGVTALIAAAMLVYVGYWLHNKAHAQAWSRFIREQVGGALAKRTWWAMAAVAFLAVYREMFEVVLFYQALWVQPAARSSHAFFGGLVAAAVTLAVVAWLIFRYSVRLPLGPFFAVTSILLATMAIVFAGQGVAALQEAGVVSITPVSFVAVPLIGMFPTAQTLAAQAAMTLVVVASFYLADRSGRTHS